MAGCRLFVYLAREAPLAVVLRRGPSDWVRLSLWRTDADEFEHGQWLRGRVYERRADLSADGALFVSFARRASGPDQAGRDTWVAVSRPPYFTALALWLVGGTYHTGGSDADFAAYGGPFVVEYALVPVSGNEVVSLGSATWADWDQRGRLVLARDGCLLELRESGESFLIADVNDQTPDPAPSPAWTRAWPEPTT